MGYRRQTLGISANRITQRITLSCKFISNIANLSQQATPLFPLTHEIYHGKK